MNGNVDEIKLHNEKFSILLLMFITRISQTCRLKNQIFLKL